MTIKSDYNFGDTVYIIQDPKQKAYDVIGIKVRPGGTIMYELDYLGDTLDMYEFQISGQRDPAKYLAFDNENDDD